MEAVKLFHSSFYLYLYHIENESVDFFVLTEDQSKHLSKLLTMLEKATV